MPLGDVASARSIAYVSGGEREVTKGYVSPVFGWRLDTLVDGGAAEIRWRAAGFCARDCGGGCEIALHSARRRHGTVLVKLGK